MGAFIGPPGENVSALEIYGRYQLIKKLATGGMAQIYLAKQLGVQGFEKTNAPSCPGFRQAYFLPFFSDSRPKGCAWRLSFLARF